MDVVVAILVKDKEATLPTFFQCLLNQTFPKERTRLYIRTNDNTDNSEALISQFLKEHATEYKSVFYNNASVSEKIKEYKNHEWNSVRFKILGKIRQESISHAIHLNSHYFVIDVDNFIMPFTLEDMFNVSGLGVVAPMLVTQSAYSNYHSTVDANGYLVSDKRYMPILMREYRGCIEVPVVHCTYFVANHVLSEVSYDDESYRYEYAIFSDVLRKKGIPQFIDNRKDYGCITFAVSKEEFEEDWKNYAQKFNISADA